MKKLFVLSLLFAMGTSHSAVDVTVEGVESVVLQSSYVGAGTSKTGVKGVATTSSSTGVYGVGGYIGARGLCSSGSSTRIGIHGLAYNGTTNYGLYGSAYGGTTNFAAYFDGNTYSTGSYQTSDVELKKNIRALEPVVGKIKSINPIRYELDESKLKYLTVGEQRVGFSAQNLEAIFPEFVKTVKSPILDENGEMQTAANGDLVMREHKAVNYIDMIPVLLAAIKEQQLQIDSLKQKIR